MASNADVTSFIASATSLGVTPAQMVVIIDTAIAQSIVDGKATVSTGRGGASVTLGYDQLMQLKRHYAVLADQASRSSSNGGAVRFTAIQPTKTGAYQ